MNCFKRIVSFIAIIAIKAMCIQFAEHFSRGRHPNFQRVHSCSWEHWVNIVHSFLNTKCLKILILYWQYLFSILVSDWDALFAKTWINSYFKNASICNKMPHNLICFLFSSCKFLFKNIIFATISWLIIHLIQPLPVIYFIFMLHPWVTPLTPYCTNP